jgi:Protein of unknown function (DUF1572)
VNELLEQYLKDSIRQFRSLKWQAEKAIAQIDDDDLLTLLGPESNSIALIMKHLAGNLRSRWTDFLNSDGEKPDRNRDSEFVMEDGETKETLWPHWEQGWQCLFSALEPLKAEDLGRTIFIRGEPHTVLEAINRQLTHYAGHVGQLIFLARHFAADQWQSLSIPRGQSAQFNTGSQKKRGQAWQSAAEPEK